MFKVTVPDNFLYSRQRLKSVSRPGWRPGREEGNRPSELVVTYVKGRALMILGFIIIGFGFMGCGFHRFSKFRGGLKIHCLLEGW